MNKLFYKLMLLVAVLSAGLPVCAASFTTGGISYNIISASGRTVEVTKNTYYQGDIVIPPSVSYGGKSYKVVAIGDMAFNDNKDVTSLVIPSSVDTIKYCAFSGCSGIKTITIEDGKSELLTHGNTNSYNGIFTGCGNLRKVYLGRNIRPVADGIKEPFRESTIQTIILGNNVSEIRKQMFYGCERLDNITIPNNVTRLGIESFYGCKSLKSVQLSNELKYIERNAFQGCEKLKGITIPEKVTSIGDEVFRGCSSLESIVIPDNVEALGQGAFYGCSNLTSIKFSKQLEFIEKNLFYGCISLQSLTIPGNITEINDPYYVFKGCSALKRITFEDGEKPLKFICTTGNAFYDSKLYYLYIGRNIEAVCLQPFKNQYIEELTFGPKVTAIEGGAFEGCARLKSVVFPNNITDIGGGAFSGCRSLETIKLSENLTRINDHTFYSCDSLTSITIPDKVTTIGRYAFGNYSGSNSKMQKIILGKKVDVIGERAFEACYRAEIISYNPVAPKIDGSSFPFGSSSYKNATIVKVPVGSYESYSQASEWKNFKNIKAVIGMIPATKIEFGTTALTVKRGESVKMDVTFTPANVTYKSLKWESTNTNVATVDANGKVTALAEGETEIIATTTDDSNLSITAAITVVKPYTLGDANGDEQITAVDVSQTVAYILGMPSMEFVFLAADVNEDGKVTAVDISLIVNKILHPSSAMMALAPSSYLSPLYGNLTAEPVEITAGRTAELAIALGNIADCTALQFDVELPQGVSVIDNTPALTDCHSHIVASRAQDNGGMRVVTFSMSNARLGENAVATMTLVADMQTAEGTYPVVIRNIHAADAMGNEYAVPEMRSTVKVARPLGVDGIDAAGLTIRTEGHNIYVKSAADTTLRLVSIDGTARTLNIVAGENVFCIENAGLYIIAGRKVVIK